MIEKNTIRGHLRGLLEDFSDITDLQRRVEQLYTCVNELEGEDKALEQRIEIIESALIGLSLSDEEKFQLFLNTNQNFWSNEFEQCRSALPTAVNACFFETIGSAHKAVVYELAVVGGVTDKVVLRAASYPSDFSRLLRAIFYFRDRALQLYPAGKKAESIKQYCADAIAYSVTQYQEKAAEWSYWRIGVADYLEENVQQYFEHNIAGKIWRLLLDIVLVPLSIVTLGNTLAAKKVLTGSYTFFGEDTTRGKLFKQVVKEFQEKETPPTAAPAA